MLVAFSNNIFLNEDLSIFGMTHSIIPDNTDRATVLLTFIKSAVNMTVE